MKQFLSLMVFGFVFSVFIISSVFAYTDLRIEIEYDDRKIEVDIDYYEGINEIEREYTFDTTDINKVYAEVAQKLNITVAEVEKAVVKIEKYESNSKEENRKKEYTIEGKRLQDLRTRVQEKKEEVNVEVEDKKAELQVKREEKKQEVQLRLNTQLQKRANSIIETFIARLENQDLTVDQIITRIDTVISRLENLSAQVRFRQLSTYIIEKLEAYKLELDNGISEIEAIFNNIR